MEVEEKITAIVVDIDRVNRGMGSVIKCN